MNQLIASKTVTMSSIEISVLVDKRHDNVKRTIEALVDKGVIASPQIEEKLMKTFLAIENFPKPKQKHQKSTLGCFFMRLGFSSNK